MNTAMYWKNALIRAARTFIQGFLGGLSANLMLGSESEIIYAAIMGGAASAISLLQNAVEDSPTKWGNNIPKG
jgi:predicted lipid-binding transport protein (Tim44 family)